MNKAVLVLMAVGLVGSVADVCLRLLEFIFKTGGATEKPWVVVVRVTTLTVKSNCSDIQTMAAVLVLFRCILVIPAAPVRWCWRADGASVGSLVPT